MNRTVFIVHPISEMASHGAKNIFSPCLTVAAGRIRFFLLGVEKFLLQD